MNLEKQKYLLRIALVKSMMILILIWSMFFPNRYVNGAEKNLLPSNPIFWVEIF